MGSDLGVGASCVVFSDIPDGLSGPLLVRVFYYA